MEVSQYTPDAFPLGDNRRLVAPFWADADTTVAGDVFYRETTDPNLLQQATNDITATFVDQRKFKATWLLIATWYKVAFYGATGINTEKVKKYVTIVFVGSTKINNDHSENRTRVPTISDDVLELHSFRLELGNRKAA